MGRRADVVYLHSNLDLVALAAREIGSRARGTPGSFEVHTTASGWREAAMLTQQWQRTGVTVSIGIPRESKAGETLVAATSATASVVHFEVRIGTTVLSGGRARLGELS